MITYELLILLRVVPKPELKTILKRTADAIFDKGVSLKNRKFRHEGHALQNNYFLYKFNVPPSTVDNLLDEYRET
ncbi:hypothetical protein NQ317_002980 [Molorchus minor]|uniref:Ribosomal protein S6 n=1 Tax=Molorchus minor TaxID=1323400 RepID=A0ABQ9J8D4_9CUCU|nr:hypothetical protein NQ317_002980 [Molorchus minor]